MVRKGQDCHCQRGSESGLMLGVIESIAEALSHLPSYWTCEPFFLFFFSAKQNLEGETINEMKNRNSGLRLSSWSSSHTRDLFRAPSSIIHILHTSLSLFSGDLRFRQLGKEGEETIRRERGTIEARWTEEEEAKIQARLGAGWGSEVEESDSRTRS